jgi:hypothetical protein
MKQIEELLFIRAYLCPTRCVVAAGRPNLVSSLRTADACSGFQSVSRIARIGETGVSIRTVLARQELDRDVARLIRESADRCGTAFRSAARAAHHSPRRKRPPCT